MDVDIWSEEALGSELTDDKLDGVAPLEADPPHAISTTRQNPPICNLPLYIAKTSELIDNGVMKGQVSQVKYCVCYTFYYSCKK